MKVQFAAILLASLLPAACGQVQTLSQAAKGSFLSSEDAAAIQVYLDDVADSAAEDASTTTADSEGTEAEDAVKDDIRAERLAQMATKMMEKLDTDTSGSLSLEEFLAGPEKRAEERGLSDEIKAKITAKMTEDFNAAAGTDAQLSSEELEALLKAAGPRVGRHRCENSRGRQGGPGSDGQGRGPRGPRGGNAPGAEGDAGRA
jgi:hypothetical protein